jgi:hypothetical protein
VCQVAQCGQCIAQDAVEIADRQVCVSDDGRWPGGRYEVG